MFRYRLIGVNDSMKKDKRVGNKYNYLLVLEFLNKVNNSGEKLYLCRCDCGYEGEFSGTQVANGHIKSCGCIRRDINKELGKKRVIPMEGKKFGRLYVVEGKEIKKEKGTIYYWCKCDCGNEKYVPGIGLRQGTSKSCGCLKNENLSSSKNLKLNEHPSWQGEGCISKTYFNNLYYRARNRGMGFDITLPYLAEVWESQEGKCSLTGIKLSPPRVKTPNDPVMEENVASVDRIDSSLGYTKGNIQWVHRVVNYMKQNYKQEVFIDWCKKVTEFNSN